MNPKRVKQVIETATPHMESGEQVIVATTASVGSVSAKRKVLTSAVVGIASGGTMIANVRPRRMYIAMTDRRLIFFDADTASGKPGKEILMSLPLAALAASEAKRGWLTLKAELFMAGESNGLRLMFPKPCREDGAKVLASVPRQQ